MKYFTMKELAKSSTADKLGIDNTPTPEASVQLSNLVTHVLDPLREMYGKPITVNSGYRCPKLNDAVGGAKNSQHMRGEAADITAGSKMENKRLFELIWDNLPFDQLIDESNYSWVHVSYVSTSKNRKQILSL
ncbi:D-Ala-D-Ala carboxypeptidase family metallohydrolase [Phocaeicola sp.]|uniref:D-Ala-D-Ala carboxypeptidase family metallohydrolase n=1 Tax=Bacteroidales TaxID=171549 RepID=UPI003AAC5790